MGTVLIVVAAFIIAFISSKFSPDNVVEEVAEEVIKEETGLDIDFSRDEKAHHEGDESK